MKRNTQRTKAQTKANLAHQIIIRKVPIFNLLGVAPNISQHFMLSVAPKAVESMN